MAVRLADGHLTASERAEEDLRAGVLRVLHDRSFADDPTRLLRLVRYATRLGFDVDPRTAELAATATVSTASGDRLGNEVRLLLREPLPDALIALGDLGRRVIHPAFRP